MRAGEPMTARGKALSKGEETFALHFRTLARGKFLHLMEREVVFCPGRKWRFDFAFPTRLIAVEVEGGTWQKGRHTSGIGFAKDAEKYNTAALLGWRVGRFTTEMVERGDAIEWVKKALG